MQLLATDNLAELVRRKHKILVQLRDIGRRQQELVDQGATQQLMELLASKGHLISALQMVERNLKPFQAQEPEQRIWRSEVDRAECAGREKECRVMLAEVIDLEKQHELKMAARRDEVASQLKVAANARTAVDAYRQQRIDQPSRAKPVAMHNPNLPSGSLDLSTEQR